MAQQADRSRRNGEIPLIRRRRRLFSQLDEWTNDYRAHKVERCLMDGLQKVVLHITGDEISTGSAWKRIRTAPSELVPGGASPPYLMIIETLDFHARVALNFQQQSPDERYLRLTCLVVSYYRYLAWDIGVREIKGEVEALQKWIVFKLDGPSVHNGTQNAACWRGEWEKPSTLFAQSLREVQRCLPYFYDRTRPTGCLLRMLDVWLMETLQKDLLTGSKTSKSPTSSAFNNFPQGQKHALSVEAGNGEFVASVCLRWRLFHTLRWCIQIAPEILEIPHRLAAGSVPFGQLIHRMTGDSFLCLLNLGSIAETDGGDSSSGGTRLHATYDDSQVYYSERDFKSDLAEILEAEPEREPQSEPILQCDGNARISNSTDTIHPLESVDFRIAVVDAGGRRLEDWWPEFIRASCNMGIPVLVKSGVRAVVPESSVPGTADAAADGNSLKAKVREIVEHCSEFKTELHDIPYPDQYGGLQGQEMSVEEYAGRSGTGSAVGMKGGGESARTKTTAEAPPAAQVWTKEAQNMDIVESKATKGSAKAASEEGKSKSGGGTFKNSTYLFIRPAPMKDYWPLQMLDHLLEKLPGVIYTTDRAQFAMGPRGTGAPVHFHRPAFNFTLMGAKRWFLFPPEHAAWSNVPIREILAHNATTGTCTGSKYHTNVNLGGAVCKQVVQRAGDIFFVPTHVGHGVLNYGTVCAAVAQEICQYGELDFFYLHPNGELKSRASAHQTKAAEQHQRHEKDAKQEIARLLSF